jgi:hypothetical protein
MALIATPRSLLLVTCSRRKRPDPGLLAAIERYDGGTFRVLRKARREGYWPEALDVLIVSAKYGLIDASTPIAFYDQQMTPARARALEIPVKRTLETYASQKPYHDVYADLGRRYRLVLVGLKQFFNPATVTFAQHVMASSFR